jgi:hypothetical protein
VFVELHNRLRERIMVFVTLLILGGRERKSAIRRVRLENTRTMVLFSFENYIILNTDPSFTLRILYLDSQCTYRKI